MRGRVPNWFITIDDTNKEICETSFLLKDNKNASFVFDKFKAVILAWFFSEQFDEYE